MANLRGLFQFRAADSTADLNSRYAQFINKGVFDPGIGSTGLTTPVVAVVPGQLSVQVLAFAGMGNDGMVFVHPAPPNAILPVRAGVDQYVVVKSVYSSSGAADVQFEVRTTASWAALLQSERDVRIILARINLSGDGGATEVLVGNISLLENNIVDKAHRSPYRGVVDNFAMLGTAPYMNTDSKLVQVGDMYLAVDKSNMYRWDGSAWLPVGDQALAANVAMHEGTNGPGALNYVHSGAAISRNGEGWPAHNAEALRIVPTGPSITVATDVNAGLNELDAKKVKKNGDSMTGPLVISSAGVALQVTSTDNNAASFHTAAGIFPGVTFTGGAAVGAGSAGFAATFVGGSGGASGASASGLKATGGGGTTSYQAGTGIESYGGQLNTSAGTGLLAWGGSPLVSGAGGQGVYAIGGAAVGTGAGGEGIHSTGGAGSGSGTRNGGNGITSTGGVKSGTGYDGYGVYGQAVGTGDAVIGRGVSASVPTPSGAGVVGIGSASSSLAARGGYFIGGSGYSGFGGNGAEVVGGSADTIAGGGLLARGGSPTAGGGGWGIYAKGGNAVTSGRGGWGIYALGGTGTGPDSGHGIKAQGTGVGNGIYATGGGTDSDGVVGRGGSTNGRGVAGFGNGYGTGVYGEAGPSSTSIGVKGYSASNASGYAVFGEEGKTAIGGSITGGNGHAGEFTNDSSGSGHGIYVTTASSGAAARLVQYNATGHTLHATTTTSAGDVVRAETNVTDSNAVHAIHTGSSGHAIVAEATGGANAVHAIHTGSSGHAIVAEATGGANALYTTGKHIWSNGGLASFFFAASTYTAGGSTNSVIGYGITPSVANEIIGGGTITRGGSGLPTAQYTLTTGVYVISYNLTLSVTPATDFDGMFFVGDSSVSSGFSVPIIGSLYGEVHIPYFTATGISPATQLHYVTTAASGILRVSAASKTVQLSAQLTGDTPTIRGGLTIHRIADYA